VRGVSAKGKIEGSNAGPLALQGGGTRNAVVLRGGFGFKENRKDRWKRLYLAQIRAKQLKARETRGLRRGGGKVDK